ncbi:uncharacterized protein LOC135929091 isoform X2 [Gordionus sp. m RMFG-2023]|uniref:uncharacterized protein LOC135929091 isoform X2 n=1 Tax=Gordionus sp. m RMFG-2023 TaxID=3053472 RepID=UPI0031FDE999
MKTRRTKVTKTKEGNVEKNDSVNIEETGENIQDNEMDVSKTPIKKRRGRPKVHTPSNKDDILPMDTQENEIHEVSDKNIDYNEINVDKPNLKESKNFAEESILSNKNINEFQSSDINIIDSETTIFIDNSIDVLEDCTTKDIEIKKESFVHEINIVEETKTENIIDQSLSLEIPYRDKDLERLGNNINDNTNIIKNEQEIIIHDNFKIIHTTIETLSYNNDIEINHKIDSNKQIYNNAEEIIPGEELFEPHFEGDEEFNQDLQTTAEVDSETKDLEENIKEVLIPGFKTQSHENIEIQNDENQSPNVNKPPLTFYGTLDTFEKLKTEVSRSSNDASSIIHVSNLVRPFTLRQLKEEFQKYGEFDETKDFWIDKIKSHCIVKYSNAESALEAYNNLNKQKWPSSNPKLLKVEFTDQNELDSYKNNQLLDKSFTPSTTSRYNAKLSTNTEIPDLNLSTTHSEGGMDPQEFHLLKNLAPLLPPGALLQQHSHRRVVIKKEHEDKIITEKESVANTSSTKSPEEMDTTDASNKLEDKQTSPGKVRYHPTMMAIHHLISKDTKENSNSNKGENKEKEGGKRILYINIPGRGNKPVNADEDPLTLKRREDREREERGRIRITKDGKDERRRDIAVPEDKTKSKPGQLMDELFRKTIISPCVYWLPLSETKAKERLENLEKSHPSRLYIHEKDCERSRIFFHDYSNILRKIMNSKPNPPPLLSINHNEVFNNDENNISRQEMVSHNAYNRYEGGRFNDRSDRMDYRDKMGFDDRMMVNYERERPFVKRPRYEQSYEHNERTIPNNFVYEDRNHYQEPPGEERYSRGGGMARGVERMYIGKKEERSYRSPPAFRRSSPLKRDYKRISSSGVRSPHRR